MHAVSTIAEDLRRLGVADGDTVMVHASLRRIGPVAGGASGVIAALDAAVGVSGTVLMVVGAEDDHAWVNERPEEEREALLVGAEPFDHLSTPASADIGVLAEEFRRAPGTLVNDHPEARFAARGRLAAELLAGTPWNDYHGAGSPLERLMRAGGKVLRLGADLNTVTLLHYAEFLVDLPAKKRDRRHRKVRAEDGGTRIVVIDTLDDTYGIVDYPHGDYFDDLMADYLSTGTAAVGTVGNARSELIEAGELVRFGVAWLERELAGLP